MKSERALFNDIIHTVLKGTDADVGAHRNTVLNACITILADSLRTADPFTRERLLRSLEREVRDSIERLSLLLDGKDGGSQ